MCVGSEYRELDRPLRLLMMSVVGRSHWKVLSSRVISVDLLFERSLWLQ